MTEPTVFLTPYDLWSRWVIIGNGIGFITALVIGEPHPLAALVFTYPVGMSIGLIVGAWRYSVRRNELDRLDATTTLS